MRRWDGKDGSLESGKRGGGGWTGSNEYIKRRGSGVLGLRFGGLQQKCSGREGEGGHGEVRRGAGICRKKMQEYIELRRQGWLFREAAVSVMEGRGRMRGVLAEAHQDSGFLGPQPTAIASCVWVPPSLLTALTRNGCSPRSLKSSILAHA